MSSTLLGNATLQSHTFTADELCKRAPVAQPKPKDILQFRFEKR